VLQALLLAPTRLAGGATAERVRIVIERSPAQIGGTLQVLVRDNNVDQALRVLKKKMQREGMFREMKARKAYEKPSERKTREKAEAIRRTRKAARKLAQREGLIPMPKKKADDDRNRSANRSFSGR